MRKEENFRRVAKLTKNVTSRALLIVVVVEGKAVWLLSTVIISTDHSRFIVSENEKTFVRSTSTRSTLVRTLVSLVFAYVYG